MIAKLTTENGVTKTYQDAGKPDFDTARRILTEHAPEVFGGEATISSMTLYTNRGYVSTYRNDKGCSKDFQKTEAGNPFVESMVTSEIADKDYVQMSDLIVKLPDGTEQTVKYGLDMYEEGFLINTGKTSTNFMGVTRDAYLDKITTKHFKLSARAAARHYKSLTDVLKFVKKNEYQFRFAVSQYDYQWSWEYASDVFRDAFFEGVTEKKRTSFEKTKEEIEELLNSINGVEAAEVDHVYGETQEEEAILRLKELGGDMFLSNFKKGKVMISDIGGIIFDLDDFANELIDSVKENGNLPYLVLRNGDMYSVLYVSEHKDDWKFERYDKRTGIILALCTTKDMGFMGMDRGDIVVTKTNAGGLMRTA